MNQNNNDTNIYLIAILIILLHFTWYYSTIPGSIFSKKKNYPKPSIKITLYSYLLYLLPMCLLVLYLNSKDKNCVAAYSYINQVCRN